jgi:peroxiredoxin
MKKLFTIGFLLCVFAAIAVLFWYTEWRYSLPTPVPEKYQAVKTREHIDLANRFIPSRKGPVFLHFFNPDCPCSKFNIPHFKSLVTEFEDKVNFAVVVLTNDKKYTAEKIQQKFGLAVPVLFDSSLAASCGVYSTPQAVLLDDDRSLYYRGNYNRSRYCTDKKSNYAQMALDSLLARKQEPVFNHYAVTAYGCSLPTCTK